MKQRRRLSNKITAVFAASIMSIALTGITCGSFAWFMYTTRAPIEEFSGVTIGVNELEMGIVSEIELPEAENYHLIKDTSYPDQLIYWIDGQVMGLDTMNYVLSMNGYATDTLYPVTTKKYSKNGDFHLYSSPAILAETQEIAKREEQIFLPLVFRCEDIVEEEYISDEDIYLSKVNFNVLHNDSHIHESLRIYTNSKNGNSHLINPSSSEDGSTNVGGVLDLNGDGFYDFDYSPTASYEHIYGQVKESNYKPSPESDDTIVYPDQRTTFNAGHKSGVYALNSCTPETADFEGMYGFRNKRKPVTTTNSLANNLAYLDLSIFIEGWDLSVVDSEIGIPFSMDLKFEISL